jgi:NTE family protein
MKVLTHQNSSNRVISFILLAFLASCSALYIPHEPDQIQSFTPKNQTRLALILGGGGSKGLAHLGAIRELENAGIRPDLIIGCSAGAVIGAFYADEPDLHSVERTFLSLRKKDLLDTNFSGFPFGFIGGKSLQNFIRNNLRSQSFHELKIPLIVVATDLFTGEVIELWQHDIATAVNASCAFPGIFNPIFLHNRYLIDGGSSCPLPVEIARKYGAGVVIAIDVSEKLSTEKPYHFFGIAKRSVEIGYKTLIQHSLTHADIGIQMEFENVGMFSDHLNDHLYQRGREKMREVLPLIQAKLREHDLLFTGLVTQQP